MKKQEAIQLLDDTFNGKFDLNQYAKFIKELFNVVKIEFIDKSTYVASQYKDYISEVYKISEYEDTSKKKMEMLTVKLGKASSRDRARTMQRNFVSTWLGKYDIDSALVAFYGEDPEDWRFSFVKMEYSLIKDEVGKVIVAKELTPAKRYSYLVGVNEPNHTCRSQLLDLVIEEDTNPTMYNIEQAFSIDNVTKEFFEKYKALVIDVKEAMDKIIQKDSIIRKEMDSKGITTIDFSKKLLGQIVFIYFLQKKGWLGVGKQKDGTFNEWGTGLKNFLRKLFEKEIVPYDNFFNDILEPLFYEALANDRSADNDYYSRFKCKVPFLNGGLFEPINEYDWSGTDIIIPNIVLENVLNTFDRFNFTVKEDEPLEKEVAVDPEMLGKVFENLLDVKERKDKGAYYTPREIVHYMCQQSLINYLETNTENVPREDIEKFIQYGDFALDQTIRALEQEKIYQGKSFVNEVYLIPQSIADNFQIIDKLLQDIKIVDPAVGSGAFPVGMMNEIVKARLILSIYFSPEEQEERTEYNLKRECIENCLYGVDIEPSAVEIAKLRFWLSLIVEEMDIKNIKPLPNLDHKIMCGNSLLEEFEGIKLFDEKLLGTQKQEKQVKIQKVTDEIDSLKNKIVQAKSSKERKKINTQITRLKKTRREIEKKLETERTSLIETESEKKIKQLKGLQTKFFNEQHRLKKKQLREDIDKIEWELIEVTLKEQDHEEAMQKLEQYKKTNVKPFFLWKLYFAEIFQRENPGFDVVIANPPYVRQEEFTDIKDKLKIAFSGFFSGRADLYTYFYKKGIGLLRREGVLTYISSNKFFVTGYGKKLRGLLTSNLKLKEIINFGELPVFQAAVDSAIIIVKNSQSLEKDKVKVTQIKKACEIFELIQTIEEKKIYVMLHNLDSKEWILQIPEKLALFKKIKDNKISLKEYFNNNIFGGIKTGLDSAFVITENVKDELIKKDPRSSALIRPWLRGKDVRKWRAQFHDLYVIYIPLNKVIIDNYPAIKEHLSKFREKLDERATDQKWFEMQQPQERFTELFNSPKIIYGEISKEMRACLDTEGAYGTMKMFFIPYDPLILGILNSKLFDWYARMCFVTLGDPWKGGRISFKTLYMREVPIPRKSDEDKTQLIKNVEGILSITKNNHYLKDSDKIEKITRFEKEINILVYRLYDLTPEEIERIENCFED